MSTSKTGWRAKEQDKKTEKERGGAQGATGGRGVAAGQADMYNTPGVWRRSHTRCCNLSLFSLASASIRLAHFSSRFCPEYRESHPEKDLMGSFSNPFGAVRAGFDNRCLIKRVQEVRACVVIQGTISDCIIATLPAFTERAALVKGRVICIGFLRWLRPISFNTHTS